MSQLLLQLPNGLSQLLLSEPDQGDEALHVFVRPRFQRELRLAASDGGDGFGVAHV